MQQRQSPGAHSAVLAAQGLGLLEYALHGRDPVFILNVEDLELQAGQGQRGHRDIWESITEPQTQLGFLPLGLT